MQNALLTEFLRMRAAMPATAKENDKPKSTLTLESIIQEKPPKKEVIKYFQKRIAEIMEEQ